MKCERRCNLSCMLFKLLAFLLSSTVFGKWLLGAGEARRCGIHVPGILLDSVHEKQNTYNKLIILTLHNPIPVVQMLR